MSDYKTLDEAFIAAQGAMEAPKKNAENPHFRSKFADLAEILSVSIPVLNAHGIALSQPTVSVDDRIGVRTIIIGYGSERELGFLLGNPPDDPQKVGSWLTYFRRYALQSALALAAEDDDANAAAAHYNEGGRTYGAPQKAAPKPSESIAVTDEAARAFTLTFGKHKGKTLGELDSDPTGRGYIKWLSENSNDGAVLANTRKLLEPPPSAVVVEGEEEVTW